MRNYLLWCLAFYLGNSAIATEADISTEEVASADTPCHPICRWECDNPVCPAICDIICADTLCQEPTCDNPDCQCGSFSPLETINCSPLPNDCPLCEVGRTGIDCVDGQAQSCSCNVMCQTKECSQVCHKPSCPKPTCELVCENPSCAKADSEK